MSQKVLAQHTVSHPFDPISDERSSILILGTMPSVQSRAGSFYYAHPRNRFWTVVASVFGQSQPESIADKTHLLLDNGVALWDVLASCDISGSDDSSIRNPVCNDIAALVSNSSIVKILCNGTKAFNLYRKHIDLPQPVHCMPSTSPANAAWSVARLVATWRGEMLDIEEVFSC